MNTQIITVLPIINSMRNSARDKPGEPKWQNRNVFYYLHVDDWIFKSEKKSH